MNVIVIGKPKYNITLPLEEFPKEGSKIKINERLEITGGVSVYVACMLAKWGINVYYSGAVCADDFGNKIKAELESYGIDLKYLDTDYEHKSNVNYLIKNKKTGTSTEIYHDNDVFTKKYKFDFIPDYIITDGTDMGACNAAANNYPTSKIILFANTVSEEFYNLSKRCSFVCANMSFAKALTKMDFEFNRSKSLVNMFQKIKDLNRAEYIIMLRERGVLYTVNRQVKMMPALSVQKVDDSNSGAAFFGAYCYGILKGYDMDTIAKSANVSGALSLKTIGTLTSIPEKEEVFKLIGIDESKLVLSSNEVSDANNMPKIVEKNENKPEDASQNPNLEKAELPKEANAPIPLVSSSENKEVEGKPNNENG